MALRAELVITLLTTDTLSHGDDNQFIAESGVVGCLPNYRQEIAELLLSNFCPFLFVISMKFSFFFFFFKSFLLLVSKF